MLADYYPWIKAAHVIAAISWMVGFLYLPRLFVYHVEAIPGSLQAQTFKVMERRLVKQIMNPAMIATWAFGLLMVFSDAVDLAGWFWVKLALVIVLSGFHGACEKWRKDFLVDGNTRPRRFYRIVNEVPAVIMVGIVIMVITKPF